MNKRKTLIAAAVAAVIGTSAVYAGSNYCDHNKGGHGFGGGHRGPGMERMISKLDRHLDLSESQRTSIEEIVAANRDTMKQGRVDRKTLRQKTMALDPASESYDKDVAVLADEMADMAREMTLSFADIARQVSAVLTPEQREEAREMIQHRMDRMEKRMQKHQSS
jgi:Spy/CpxP family protein refolding chaperone